MAQRRSDKQRHFRQRQLEVDGKRRVQCFVSLEADAKLKRLARYHGYSSMRELLENLAAKAENDVVAQIPIWEWDEVYYHYFEDMNKLLSSRGQPRARGPQST